MTRASRASLASLLVASAASAVDPPAIGYPAGSGVQQIVAPVSLRGIHTAVGQQHTRVVLVVAFGAERGAAVALTIGQRCVAPEVALVEPAEDRCTVPHPTGGAALPWGVEQ